MGGRPIFSGIRWRRRLLAVLLSAFCLAAIFWPTVQGLPDLLATHHQKTPIALRGGEENVGPDWPTYGGQPGGSQYSSIRQINRSNVRELKVAWTYNSGDMRRRSKFSHPTTSEVTPILANDSLYLCTPLSNVVSLDPSTGVEKWRFEFAKSPEETTNPVYNCRGVSYWESGASTSKRVACEKRVIEATDSGFLLALDADTGLPCIGFGVNGKVDLNALDYAGDGRISVTSPPAIAGDVIVIGGTVADNRDLDTLDGIVRGFDVRSGKELWSWNPIPADLSDRVGGANTWAPISVDEERGWVFLPTGSPSWDNFGTNRIGRIPDGNAVVVLDAQSGKKIWSYQTTHHDLWDYDLAAMPTLGTVVREGRRVDAVIQATKTGMIFLLDRETGRPLFPVEERPVPMSDIPGETSAATQPFPVLPAPVSSHSLSSADAWGITIFDQFICRERISALRNEGLYTPPSLHGSLLYPSFLGGVNWGGLAYDELNSIAVVNSTDVPLSIQLHERKKFDRERDAPEGYSVFSMDGSPYMATRGPIISPWGVPCNPPPWGRLTAIDMNSGETLWQVPFGGIEVVAGISSPSAWGAPNQGGPIITGGGLIFIGASLDARLRAYDLATGEELWSEKLPAPATATPMTYDANGRQFVVIAAGGHASLKTELSDAIVAFSLQ